MDAVQRIEKPLDIKLDDPSTSVSHKLVLPSL
jgi:hypothetical protein